jgi:hypothetical protein
MTRTFSSSSCTALRLLVVALSSFRSLPAVTGQDFTLSFAGDTTAAPVSTGNPADKDFGTCSNLVTCINGCRSVYYRVTGVRGTPIVASTCGSVAHQQRLYVWDGSGAECSSFRCASTLIEVGV